MLKQEQQKNKPTETAEELKGKIKYSKGQIKKLENQLHEMQQTCIDPKSLYFKADVAMLRSDIANYKATIFLCNEKLKQMGLLEQQPGE